MCVNTVCIEIIIMNSLTDDICNDIINPHQEMCKLKKIRTYIFSICNSCYEFIIVLKLYYITIGIKMCPHSLNRQN